MCTAIILLGLSFCTSSAEAHLIPPFSIEYDQNDTNPMTHILVDKLGHPSIIIPHQSQFTLSLVITPDGNGTTYMSFNTTIGNDFSTEVMPQGISIDVVPRNLTLNGNAQKINVMINVGNNAYAGIYYQNLISKWTNNFTTSRDVTPITFQIGKINENTPLKQSNMGIATSDIVCKNGLYLAIKLQNGEPTCLKAGTISKLASRGFFYGTSANESEANYTTILIPPGSENQESNNTYSPNVATVVLGTNNTVQWVNQADVGNSVASDKNIQQNGKSFESSSIFIGQSYKFTFTEPGTFTYHGRPHPWQTGTIIVLPNPHDIETPVKINTVNQNVKLVSIQSVQPTTPGGPRIQVTVENTGSNPITSLNATLYLNNYYNFDFQDVSESHPLLPGNSTSDTMILIGGGFIDGATYSFTMDETANNIPSSFTQSVQIPYTDQNIVKNSTMITSLDSFGGCDTAYEPRQNLMPILYMPANSTGKLCVQYSNPNQSFPSGFDILEAQNYSQNTDVISSSSPNTVQSGNSTVIDTIHSGNKAGFYRMLISCPGMQLAIGYDNSSNFVPNDFPWLGQTFYCPMQSGEFHIIGLSGIGVKYIPYP